MLQRARSRKETHGKHENAYLSLIRPWECVPYEMSIWLSRCAADRPLFASQLVGHTFKAVSENLELKQRIFSELAAETRPDTILATNTSSISITKIATSALPQGESAASAVGKSSAGRVVGELYVLTTGFTLQLQLGQGFIFSTLSL
jgi:3-hydroxyacyl-CoA dehydrogenase